MTCIGTDCVCVCADEAPPVDPLPVDADLPKECYCKLNTDDRLGGSFRRQLIVVA